MSVKLGCQCLGGVTRVCQIAWVAWVGSSSDDGSILVVEGSLVRDKGWEFGLGLGISGG